MKIVLIRRSLVTAVACALAAAVIFLAVNAPSIAAARRGTDAPNVTESSQTPAP